MSQKKVLSVVASLRLKVAIIPTSQGVPFGVNCEVNTDALPKVLVNLLPSAQPPAADN